VLRGGQPTEQRIANVRILLTSFYDYLPAPVTSSGLVTRAASSGPAPGKRVPCTYCRRTGRVRQKNSKSRFCPVCDGSGWRPRRRLKPSHPSYEQPWDEYTREPVEEEQVQHPHAMTRYQLDRALERLESYERGERFGWEREREVYQRRGSYGELALALDRLSRQWHVGYLQIRRTYLRGLSFEPSPLTSELTEIAEEWLAREMRGKIRVPVWLAEQVAGQREATVQELHEQGLAAGTIAKRLRIPKLKVQRMLRSFTLSTEVVTGASGKART
jgi:hypothetical protein